MLQKPKFFNDGFSRGRILVAFDNTAVANPKRIQGTRLITFNDTSLELLAWLFASASWPVLNDEVPGGVTSNFWRKVRDNDVEEPTAKTHDKLTIYNFGEGNSRVILLSAAVPTPKPLRIPGVNIVADSPTAVGLFNLLVAAMPGDTKTAVAMSHEVVPMGLGGSTLITLKRFSKSFVPF